MTVQTLRKKKHYCRRERSQQALHAKERSDSQTGGDSWIDSGNSRVDVPSSSQATARNRLLSLAHQRCPSRRIELYTYMHLQYMCLHLSLSTCMDGTVHGDRKTGREKKGRGDAKTDTGVAVGKGRKEKHREESERHRSSERED